MKHHNASEMYLKTILLLEADKGSVHVKDIADILSVSKASVTKAINALRLKSFIQQDNYGPVFLTEAGRSMARAILYKHNVLTRFLEIELNLSFEEAEENACRMEHIITDNLLSALEEKLGDNLDHAL